MTKTILAILSVLWAVLCLGGTAEAQSTAKVLATCGTAGYSAGTTNYQTVDTTGAGCSNGGSGASAGQVQGNVAAGATDSGNPVKIGGIYNSTLPTYTNGQRGDAQIGTKGGLQIGHQAVATTGVDAQGNAYNTPSDGSGSMVFFATRPQVFNGTTWDRQRGTTNGTQIIGAGASAAALTGNPVLIAGGNGTNAYTLQTDTNGTLVGPKAGTGDRVVTKTNLSANTSTQICPTATNPIATEIFFTTAGVGISLAGGTLTQATIGVTATTQPDWYENAANSDYLAPAGITNAITAYGAAGIVSCIQYLRQ